MESGAIHVPVKSHVMGVLCIHGVWILDTNQAMIVISNQHNISAFCQTLLHAVEVAFRCALGRLTF